MSPRLAPPTARRAALVGGATVVGFLLPAVPALAHPGHPGSGFGSGLGHPPTGPDHLLAMVAVGVVAAFASRRWVAWATPAAFVGGMVLGAVLGLGGVSIPGTETAIALSVVALGAIVVTTAGRDGTWLPVVVGLFGVAHGVAHGAEAPSAASPVAYVAGFVVATVALHAAGAGAGWTVRRAPAVRMAMGAAVSASGVALLLGA